MAMEDEHAILNMLTQMFVPVSSVGLSPMQVCRITTMSASLGFFLTVCRIFISMFHATHMVILELESL